MEPTLEQIFGANATQDATDIVIKKADLVAVGLVAAADNNPESLFVALIKNAALILTPENRDLNADQSIVIGEYSESISTSLVNNAIRSFNQITVPVELYTVRDAISINPMNY
mgnify:CR=1 FL=1